MKKIKMIENTRTQPEEKKCTPSTLDRMLQSGLTSFFGSFIISALIIFIFGLKNDPAELAGMMFPPVFIVSWIYFSRKKSGDGIMKNAKAEIAAKNTRESKKQTTNYMYWIIGVAAIILLAAGIYHVASNAQQNTPPANTQVPPPATLPPKNQTPQLQTGAKVLLSSLDKVSNFPQTYEMVFFENISGIRTEVDLKSYANGKTAKISTPFNNRTMFWMGGDVIVCESTPENGQMCANVNQSGPIGQLAAQIERTFVNRQGAAVDFARDTKLVNMGAMKFMSQPTKKTIAGRPCTAIDYRLDYGPLSLNQMREVGVDPNDPIVTAFKNFKVNECLDDQLGNPLQLTATYEYLGQLVKFTREFTKVSAPLSGNAEKPPTLASEAELNRYMTETETMLSVYGMCAGYAGEDANNCFAKAAVENDAPKYCELSKNQTIREQCYYVIATRDAAPALCAKAPSLNDDCYNNVAIALKNSAYCGQIRNATISAACINATKSG